MIGTIMMRGLPSDSVPPEELGASPLPPPDEQTQQRTSPTASLLTLPRSRPATPQGELIPLQDVFNWHRGPCRDVLFQFVQTCTLRDVRQMTESEEILRERLNKFLVRRVAEEDDMWFLEFPPRDLRVRQRMRSSSRVSVSSSSSTSSKMSRSSQVSDSDLNDVQQSAEIFRAYLTNARQQLRALERPEYLSKFVTAIEFKLKGHAEELEATINTALGMLRNNYTLMGSYGFPDLGLAINNSAERFKGTVLQPLQKAKKKSKTSDFLSTFLKRISNKRSSERAAVLDDYSGVHYPDLIRETQAISENAKLLLMQAESTTEAFIDVAMTMMEPIVQALAQRLDYDICDTCEDGILVSRTFSKSVLPLGILRSHVAKMREP